MTISTKSEAISIRCPRCGYELRGEVASWRTSCPLHGACSECGLEIDWSVAFSGGVVWSPRWMIEFEALRWKRIIRALLTAMAAWQPLLFWRNADMRSDIRAGRVLSALVIWGLLIAVPSYFVGRSLVVLRVHENIVQNYPANTVSLSRAFRHGVLLSRSRTSPGTVAGAGRRMLMYPPPSSLYRYIRGPGPRTGTISERSVLERMAQAAWLIVFAAVFQTACPLAFAALPLSIRRARVRAAHVVRIWAYALYLLLPAIVLIAAAYILTTVSANIASSLISASFIVSLALVPLATAIFWRCALSRYLRMPHAWGITAAILTIALLATALAVYGIVQPGAWADLVHPLTYRRIL